MKRSARLFAAARQCAWMAMLLLGVTAALLCWVPSAWLSIPLLGLLLGVSGLISATLTTIQMAETARLFRIADDEERREWASSIRPRL